MAVSAGPAEAYIVSDFVDGAGIGARRGVTRPVEHVTDIAHLGKRCSGSTLPAPRAVVEVRGWTRPALRPHWTPTLECL